MPYLRSAGAVTSETSRGGLRIVVCTRKPLDWGPSGWGEPPRQDVVGALGELGSEVVDLHPGAPLDALIERIAGLDLVISTDVEVAHLAGALGRPLIVLLDVGGGWAWPEVVPSTLPPASPWYAEARVLRQRSTEDFTPLLARLGELVKEMLGVRWTLAACSGAVSSVTN